jgi:nucleotide-binding universal stress UspA family protein
VGNPLTSTQFLLFAEWHVHTFKTCFQDQEIQVMFEKILVAMDYSDMGEPVFESALTLAKANSARLMLLHALSAEEEGSPEMFANPSLSYYPILNDTALSVYRERWEAFERRGLDLLRTRADEAIAQGLKVEWTQNPGSPGRVICDLARTWEADLIIMGRRGLSGLKEILVGSVSNYVLHHAPCSVLTVHPKAPVEAETREESLTSITSA